MLQNVLSFFAKYQPYFQMALGVWQILKFTPPAGVIKGVIGRLLSFALPGFFPAYEQLQDSPGCLFKTVKCVVLTTGKSQSKTKPRTNPKIPAYTFSRGKFSRTASLTDTDPATPTSGPEDTQTGPGMFPRETELIGTDPVDTQTGPSKREAESIRVHYLGEKFVVKREGNKVFVNGKLSYYISDNRPWEKILAMKKKCFKEDDDKGSEKEKEKEVVLIKGCQSKKKKLRVVFIEGCQFISQTVATGKIMEFGEVLDDVIFENNDSVLNFWFLPVDLSEKSEEKLPQLLNLVGLFFSTHKKTSLVLAKSFSIASAILEIKPVRSCISSIINKMFCGLMQYICNKLPYAVRRFVYWLFIWVENLMPRNDIQLKVERRDCLNVVIGGSAKININRAKEFTQVVWLHQKEKEEEYSFTCGCSIVMKATYDDSTKKCTATMQRTSAVFPTREQKVLVNCQCPDEFKKIGTFLWCLSTSKAGSLLEYDRNDNKVHVRGWRESLRHYEEAGFPEIYKLRLHDVIV